MTLSLYGDTNILTVVRLNLLKSLWHYNTRKGFGLAQRYAEKSVVLMTHIILAINQSINHSLIYSFRIVSYERSIVFSKASSPQSAI